MLFFLILILVASVALGFIILVQNPKGGGLASNIAGFSNQFMGVKQTTDVLEKGTWVFAVLIALLCLFSGLFIKQTTGTIDVNAKPGTQQTTPNQPLPNPPLNQPNQPK